MSFFKVNIHSSTLKSFSALINRCLCQSFLSTLVASSSGTDPPFSQWARAVYQCERESAPVAMSMSSGQHNHIGMSARIISIVYPSIPSRINSS